MQDHQFDYGKIELSRAHNHEKRVLENWRVADEAEYFKRHPIARAKRSMGLSVLVPPVEHSLTIYEARRGGQSLFLARATGEISGGVRVKNRHFEFDRLISTRREAYDLYFPDDKTGRFPSENTLHLFSNDAARKFATIDKSTVDAWAKRYAQFCAKSRGERIGAIGWRLCEDWRLHIADTTVWTLEAMKTHAATDLAMSCVCSIVAHYHVAFGGEEVTSDDWMLVAGRLFPDSTLAQVAKRVHDFQRVARAMADLENALTTTKHGLRSSLDELAPILTETWLLLEQILDRAYWHGRWLEPEYNS
jgi:hypothetical protein